MELENKHEYLKHLLRFPISKTSRTWVTNYMKINSMKLGVAYNLFDGEELLEASIKSIRPVVDYICVIYQKTSYYGQKATSDIEEMLHCLKDKKGLIDEIYLYEKDFNKMNDKHFYEREKRDIGLKLCKKAGMTHFMSMDVDEFYDANQLKKSKEYIALNNIKSSACSIYEYLKYPEYRIINGYTYETHEPYNFYVPFIMKIHKFKKQKHGSDFYTFSDPTRALNYGEKFYLFPVQDVVMHHMCTVRKNLSAKYKNSNCNAEEMTKKIIQSIQNEVLSWEPQDNCIGNDYYKFKNKVVQKVDNVYSINIEEDTILA